MLRRLHQKYYDLIAIIASITCAIHCAALPILASLSASSGLMGEHSHGFDNFILVITVIFAYKSLWSSYSKTGNPTFVIIAAVGFAIIFMGRFLPRHFEIMTSIIGGLSIATAHFMHLRVNAQSKDSVLTEG